MPGVGKKKFPYTKQGMAAAKSYAKRTGQPIKKYQEGGVVHPNLSIKQQEQHRYAKNRSKEITIQTIDSTLDSLKNKLDNIPKATNPHRKRMIEESINSRIEELTEVKNRQIFGDKYAPSPAKIDNLRNMIPKFNNGGPINTNEGNTPADLEIIKKRIHQMKNHQEDVNASNNAKDRRLASINNYKKMKMDSIKKAMEIEKTNQIKNSNILKLYTKLIDSPDAKEIKDRIMKLKNKRN